MSDTLPNIALPKGEWINLYASSGIVVGTKISIESLSFEPIQLVTQAAQPVGNPDGFQRLNPKNSKSNQAGDSGAWARSIASNGLVNVREV